MAEGIQLDPGQMIEALQRRVVALTLENTQLEAAVTQLQAEIAQRDTDEAGNPNIEDLYEMSPKDVPFLNQIEDVTDEVARAEITK